MVEIATSQVGGRLTDFMVLHDLLIDVSPHRARNQPGCMQNTSRRVVQSYASHTLGDTDAGPAPDTWQLSTLCYGCGAENFCNDFLEVEDDGFVLRNIFACCVAQACLIVGLHC